MILWCVECVLFNTYSFVYSDCFRSVWEIIERLFYFILLSQWSFLIEKINEFESDDYSFLHGEAVWRPLVEAILGPDAILAHTGKYCGNKPLLIWALICILFTFVSTQSLLCTNQPRSHVEQASCFLFRILSHNPGIVMAIIWQNLAIFHLTASMSFCLLSTLQLRFVSVSCNTHVA